MQKYKLGYTWTSGSFKFEVIGYEETLSDDKDDHYEVCFDKELNLNTWIKQSNIDKMLDEDIV